MVTNFVLKCMVNFVLKLFKMYGKKFCFKMYVFKMYG